MVSSFRLLKLLSKRFFYLIYFVNLLQLPRLIYFLLHLLFLYFEGSFFQIGSTEWVEENLGDLQSKAVAYLNVDCAVQGMGLFAGSTPQLDKLLIDVTRQVKGNYFTLAFFSGSSSLLANSSNFLHMVLL